ncbi:hypothetical protein [Caudoviricetes sp.]|nr:hypothetical protein [Caudoviricetes sp.]
MAKPLDPIPSDTLPLIQQWHYTKAEMQRLQAQEKALRAQVVDLVFQRSSDSLDTGTIRLDCGDGIKIKGQFGVTRKFRDLDAVDSVLDAMGRESPEGAEFAKRIVRIKYELDAREFANLPEKYLKMVEPLIETSPSSPQIEVEFPK